MYYLWILDHMLGTVTPGEDAMFWLAWERVTRTQIERYFFMEF